MTDPLPIRATVTKETPTQDLPRGEARVQAKQDLKLIKGVLRDLREVLWREVKAEEFILKTDDKTLQDDAMMEQLREAAFHMGMQDVPQVAGQNPTKVTSYTKWAKAVTMSELGEVMRIRGNLTRMVRRDYDGTEESALVIPLGKEFSLQIPVSPANMQAVAYALNKARTSLQHYQEIGTLDDTLKARLQRQLLPAQIVRDIAECAVGCSLHDVKTGEVTKLGQLLESTPQHGLTAPYYVEREKAQGKF